MAISARQTPASCNSNMQQLFEEDGTAVRNKEGLLRPIFTEDNVDIHFSLRTLVSRTLVPKSNILHCSALRLFPLLLVDQDIPIIIAYSAPTHLRFLIQKYLDNICWNKQLRQWSSFLFQNYLWFTPTTFSKKIIILTSNGWMSTFVWRKRGSLIFDTRENSIFHQSLNVTKCTCQKVPLHIIYSLRRDFEFVYLKYNCAFFLFRQLLYWKHWIWWFHIHLTRKDTP